MSQSLPQNKVWAQVSYQDSIFPLQYGQNGIAYGSFEATTGIDLVENLGKVRLGKRMILNTSTDDVSQITAPPIGFWQVGGQIVSFAGAGFVGYPIVNDGTLTDAFVAQVANNPVISIQSASTPVKTAFSGAGLNDLNVASGNPDTTNLPHTYVVTISSTGTPDHFTFTVDGGSPSSAIAITGSNQILSNGVEINFTATTGHTNGNSWTIKSGLNDLSLPSGSSDNSSSGHTYIITISTAGTTDQFTYTIDGGSPSVAANITGSAQTIANGVTIQFAATTGHRATNDSWTIVTTGSPTTIDSTISDAVFSNNALYVSAPDPSNTTFAALYKKIGTAPWTKITLSSIVTSYPLMMFAYQGRTYVSNSQSSIFSMDVNDAIVYTGSFTVTLDSMNSFVNVITRPLAGADRIWILCVNLTGGRGNIFEWDGSSTTYSKKHTLHAAGALAGCLYHDVPYIMDTNGNLQYWNGSTFKTVASLYRKGRKLLYNPISAVNNRFTHPNSMAVVDEKILIEIDNRNYDATSSIETTITAGIYEFDPLNANRGLVHKHAFGLSKANGSIVDFGALRIAGAGGISEMNLPSTSSTRNGTFLAGVGFYKDATTVRYGIYYDDINDTLQKAGSFITLKFEATDIKQKWNALIGYYKKLLNSTDQWVLKFQTDETLNLECIVTWVSANTFTVLASAITMSTYWVSGIGAEVEFIQGQGAGLCAHITNAVNNAGTWTVTIDQSITGVSGTAQARFGIWNRIGIANYGQGETFLKGKPEKNSRWIKAKLWMQWSGKNEIEGLTTVDVNMLPKTG